MNQLIEYIIALTNLYGMVHKDKVVEIYNSQNEDQISTSNVEVYLSNQPYELKDIFIYPYQDYFVHEAILKNDKFNLMLKKKVDKLYYIPKKNELLKYIDEGHFEKSKQYNALFNYVKKHFFNGDDEKAELLCEDIHRICQFGMNMQSIFDAFNDIKLKYNMVNISDIRDYSTDLFRKLYN